MTRVIFLRFSLRFLLLAVTGCACFFAYICYRESLRREVLSIVESSGGMATFSDSATLTLFQSERVTSITLPQSALASISNEQLQRFSQLTKVVVADFRCQVGERRREWTAREYPVDASKTDFLDALRSGSGVATHDEMMDARHDDWYKMRYKR